MARCSTPRACSTDDSRDTASPSLGHEMAQAAADDLVGRAAPGRRAHLVAAAAHAAVGRADRRGVRPRAGARRARHRAREPLRGQAHARPRRRAARRAQLGVPREPVGAELGRAVRVDRRPACCTRSTTRGTSTDGGDVVIVSHQLPIWMVHRRARRQVARRTTRAAVAARCRASRRSSAAASGSSRSATPTRRRASPPRPPTWGRCDAPDRSRLALAIACSRWPSALLLDRLHERPARRPVPRGQRQELHRRRRHHHGVRAEPSAASRSSSRARPSRASTFDSADHARQVHGRQLLVRRLRAVPRRGADPAGRARRRSTPTT